MLRTVDHIQEYKGVLLLAEVADEIGDYANCGWPARARLIVRLTRASERIPGPFIWGISPSIGREHLGVAVPYSLFRLTQAAIGA